MLSLVARLMATLVVAVLTLAALGYYHWTPWPQFAGALGVGMLATLTAPGLFYRGEMPQARRCRRIP